MEYHPRIHDKLKPLNSNRIILGSFPVWSLTNPDLEKNETSVEKEAVRISNNDILFYYGSSTNQFWNWYKKYVDYSIEKAEISSIQKSLDINKIGITDMIFRCSREGRSALDKHLKKRYYNHSFFQYPKKDEIIKILCTSKGVMNEMLLTSSFFREHSNIKVDEKYSLYYQNIFLANILGNETKKIKPFFISLKVEDGGTIECFAIPSPGSPFRRLTDFGHQSGKSVNYLDSYLKGVFNWFTL